MKNVLSLLVVMLIAATGSAQTLVEGLDGSHIITSSAKPSTGITADKWYIMYNQGRKAYVYGAGSVTTSPVANGSTVNSSYNYLVRLVNSETPGKYLIQNAEGKYYKDFTYNTNAGLTSLKTEAGNFTIAEIQSNTGHWYVMGSQYVMDSNGSVVVGWATTPPTSTGGNSDWAFYDVDISSANDLTGGALVNYQLVSGGLFRVHNRNKTEQCIYEITTTKKASTQYKRTDAGSNMAQMWIIEHDKSGFSLRNAKTGNYLQPDYTCNTSKYYWNIVLSPNNTSNNDPYIIICHGEIKSQTKNCANLNGGNMGLTDWYYDNDKNSEWTISAVESSEVSSADVKANLDQVCNSGSINLEEGVYYRFMSIVSGQLMAEKKSDNSIITMDSASNAWNEYWKVSYDAETGYHTLQNVFTGRSLAHKAYNENSPCGGNYSATSTNTSYHTWILKPSDYPWQTTYVLAEPAKPTTGVAVSGSTTYNASISAVDAQWIVNRVDLTQEQLAMAAEEYQDFNTLKTTSTSLLNTRLQNFFADYACTTLKDEYLTASNEELTEMMTSARLPKVLVNIAIKVKEQSWQHREKEFRIYDYAAYSDYSKWNSPSLVGTNYAFSPQTGPTGIGVNQGDVVLIFCNQNAPISTTLTLSCNKGYNVYSQETNLQRGLNIYVPEDEGFLYVHYTITNTSKKLADFNPITIHIEGGRVQGYFDITRNHTNADWKDMCQTIFKDKIVHMKSKYYQYNMDFEGVKGQIKDGELEQYDTDGVAKGIEGTLHRWDQLVENQRKLMNIDKYIDRFNCMLSASSSSTGNPYASSYGTYYPGVGTIMSYAQLTHGWENDHGGNYWCIAHETGHIHQHLINMAGCTEISVNFFSQVCNWLQGSNVGRGDAWSVAQTSFLNNAFWNEYDLWQRSRMYFQLWLYFHLQGHDTTFYPRLWDKMRELPMSHSTDPSNPGSGTTDYLRFAKYCCDVAQADLSEFFRFWGFFKPVNNYKVDDYTDSYVTTTQADINAAIAYMQRYQKKLGNILFIDERIKKYPADYPGMPEGTMRVATTPGTTPGVSSIVGETGMFTDFVDNPEYMQYSFVMSSATGKCVISTSSGKGAVGFKIYNSDHDLVYVSNTHTFNLPLAIRTQPFYVKAALGDGTDRLIYDPRDISDVPVISAQDTDVNTNAPYYDLNGQRVSNPQHGNIYIQDGVKIKM